MIKSLFTEYAECMASVMRDCKSYPELELVVLKDDKIKVFTRGDLHCPYYQTLGETLKANGWEVNIKKVD